MIGCLVVAMWVVTVTANLNEACFRPASLDTVSACSAPYSTEPTSANLALPVVASVASVVPAV